MNEWWTFQQTALIGGLGGSSIGVLGGVMGSMIGICAPRGIARRLVFGCIGACVVLGVVLAIAGIVALAGDQPTHVWLPLILGGSILDITLVPLIPVVRLRYRQADQRKLDAQSLRQGA